MTTFSYELTKKPMQVSLEVILRTELNAYLILNYIPYEKWISYWGLFCETRCKY